MQVASSVTSYQQMIQKRLLAQARPPGGVKAVPLHGMANACCSSGACHSANYWPIDYPQDGLLQLERTGIEVIPVDLFAFTSRGVSVSMSSQHLIDQGDQGTLITQAHGAGCRYQRVICCWHRLHPHDSHKQCAGLRLVG